MLISAQERRVFCSTRLATATAPCAALKRPREKSGVPSQLARIRGRVSAQSNCPQIKIAPNPSENCEGKRLNPDGVPVPLLGAICAADPLN